MKEQIKTKLLKAQLLIIEANSLLQEEEPNHEIPQQGENVNPRSSNVGLDVVDSDIFGKCRNELHQCLYGLDNFLALLECHQKPQEHS